MLEIQDLIAERYLIRSRLHHGYMSDVYHAYDQQLQCDVAIKVVCHEQTESKLRLQSEIQTLGSLDHEHILPILAHGEYKLYHYLVMPYCKQGTLHKRISNGPLTREEAGRVLNQVASALQIAHDHAILHRDIKPSNILLGNEDDLYVYLADFGLAKAIASGSDITQDGFLIGTPEYMAPELIDEPESVSSDIYALGILLYHMITGQPPFKGTTPLAVLSKHVREQPISPSSLNPAITPPVEQVILRAMHKNPKKRFSSAKELDRAYTIALQSSRQTTIQPGFSIFERFPVSVTLKKGDDKVLRAQSVLIEQSRNYFHVLRRAIISLVLVAMFIIPLSLGFLVGRAGVQVSPALGAVQSASVLHKPVLPASSPSSTPAKGKPKPPRVAPPVLHHKNHHKHGSDNTGENEM